MHKLWEQKELPALQLPGRESKIIRKALGATSHLFPRAENVQSRQGTSPCLNSFTVLLNTLGNESDTKLRMHWEINAKVFSFCLEDNWNHHPGSDQRSIYLTLLQQKATTKEYKTRTSTRIAPLITFPNTKLQLSTWLETEVKNMLSLLCTSLHKLEKRINRYMKNSCTFRRLTCLQNSGKPIRKTKLENNQVSSSHSSTWCVLTWELLLQACLTIRLLGMQQSSLALLFFLALAHPSQPKQSHPGGKPGAEGRLVIKRFNLGRDTL